MKKIRIISACLFAAACAFSVASCTSTNIPVHKPGEKVKVGLICLHNEGSTYDKNFIDAWKVAFANNDKVIYDETCIKTGIEESTDCYDAAKALVKEGCKMIFADSFGHGPYMAQAAEEYPTVQFCHATGTNAMTSGLNNLHNAFASIYEGRYIEGIAAGLALKNKTGYSDTTKVIKAGYVGAHPFAEVKSGYTSWFLGLRSVYPNATMDVEFTNSWYDPILEREKANHLISTYGCDVISQHADSMGAPDACQSAGVLNVCYNVSTQETCVDTYVGHSAINWAPYFRAVVDSMYSGKVIEKEVNRNWAGTFAQGSVVCNFTTNRKILTEENITELNNKIDELKKMSDSRLAIWDVNSFTVDTTAGKNAGATTDAEGHLTSYIADVEDDGTYTGETEVVLTKENDARTKYVTFFSESSFRSAPYFALDINGITLHTA